MNSLRSGHCPVEAVEIDPRVLRDSDVRTMLCTGAPVSCSFAAIALVLGAACNALTGIDDLEVGNETTGSGSQTSSGGEGGAPGATGSSGTKGSTSSAPSGSTSASSGSATTSPARRDEHAGAFVGPGQRDERRQHDERQQHTLQLDQRLVVEHQRQQAARRPTRNRRDMVGMTAAHNAAAGGGDACATATPALPPMAWSSTVAASAQAWANNCVFADTGPPYGSNAFARPGTYTPAQVVAAWAGVDADYDYATNTCSADCGHYTQVVWRDSVGLGCGMATCTKNFPFGGGAQRHGQLLDLRNYNPAPATTSARSQPLKRVASMLC